MESLEFWAILTKFKNNQILLQKFDTKFYRQPSYLLDERSPMLTTHFLNCSGIYTYIFKYIQNMPVQIFPKDTNGQILCSPNKYNEVLGCVLPPSSHCSILIKTPLASKAGQDNDLSITPMCLINLIDQLGPYPIFLFLLQLRIEKQL